MTVMTIDVMIDDISLAILDGDEKEGDRNISAKIISSSQHIEKAIHDALKETMIIGGGPKLNISKFRIYDTIHGSFLIRSTEKVTVRQYDASEGTPKTYQAYYLNGESNVQASFLVTLKITSAGDVQDSVEADIFSMEILKDSMISNSSPFKKEAEIEGILEV